MTSKLLTLFLAAIVVFGTLLAGCDSAPPPTQLATAKQKSAQCVEPTSEMRSHHMDMLMHQRDATLLEGIRTKQHSLNECINCHITPTKADGSPLHYGDKEHFCTTCHKAVGVKLDCFQCHADRPQVMQTPNYQHQVGSIQGQHFSQGISQAPAPTLNQMQMVAQPNAPTRPLNPAATGAMQ
jgi:outer membrane murein-binding lipoprotein Lpp